MSMASQSIPQGLVIFLPEGRSGLCHDTFLPYWFLLSLLTSLVPFLDLEVYCPGTDEEKCTVFHEYHPVDIVHFSKKAQHYLLEFMINLMKMELYLRT